VILADAMTMDHLADDNYNQRMPSCAYYNPPSNTNFNTQNYYKDSYIPETVEYTQLPDTYTPYSLNQDDLGVKSEPGDFNQESGLPHTLGYSNSNVEAYKLERKRERNRIAASKCRMRKIERIQQLEEEVSQLKEEKDKLGQVADQLKTEVERLRGQIKQHIENGCDLQKNKFRGPDSTC